MVEPLKNAEFLDNWIKTQAFRCAYNEKTRGFIGKKFIKERITNTIPPEFVARGLTREKVGLRLTEMLANDLTQALIRDCDEKRIKASEAEASALRNVIVPSDKHLGVIDDKGIPIIGAGVIGTMSKVTNATPSIQGTTTTSKSPGIPGLSGNYGTTYNFASTTGAGKSSAGGTGGVPSADSFFNKGGVGIEVGTGSGSRLSNRFPGSSSNNRFGVTVQSSVLEKGKKPMTAPIKAGVEEDRHEGIAAGEPKQVFVPSPPLSVSDVDRAIADFVAARSPGTPEVRLTTSPKLTVAGNSKDIFSRGGSSTPARSGSPASSIFISPPPAPPPDPDIPSLPFKHQYRILTTLQSILESACFDFARKHYPNFLVQKGWDCPEAGELTQWTRGLVAEFRENPTRVVKEAEHLPLAMKATDEIRHSAVHRVHVSGRDIQRLIENSRVVVYMIGDTKRIREIDEINAVIERNIQTVLDQRRKKEEKLRIELEKLEEWKRILELREMRAIKQAEREEERIQRSFHEEVGRALESLGAEESAEYRVGTDAESVSGSHIKEDEPAHSETEEKHDVEGSTPEQQEEYFHELEGWPVDEGDESVRE